MCSGAWKVLIPRETVKLNVPEILQLNQRAMVAVSCTTLITLYPQIRKIARLIITTQLRQFYSVIPEFIFQNNIKTAFLDKVKR